MILVTTPSSSFSVVVVPSEAITFTAEAGFPEIKLEQVSI
jgi:hypothetical protein